MRKVPALLLISLLIVTFTEITAPQSRPLPSSAVASMDRKLQRIETNGASAHPDQTPTEFTEEDRLFFEQIKERAAKNEQMIKTARANPQFEKFSLGIRKLIEEMMIQRMGENDKIVTRYWPLFPP